MSVASRLKKQRKTNVWPFVLAGGGLVVFLLVAAVIVVASANSRGNIAARGDESPPVTQTGGGGGWGFSLPGVTRVPEREVVLEQWYYADHKEDFGRIVRWSRPYRYPEKNMEVIIFRFESKSGIQDDFLVQIRDGKIIEFREHIGSTQWASPGMENVPATED